MDIQSFIDQPPDYSREFTARVESLAERLASESGIPIRHDKDMNYSVGQLIKVYLAPDGSPVPDEKEASLAVTAAISSKGPLYTLLARQKKDDPFGWHPAALSDVLKTSRGGQVVEAINRVMEASGLMHVPEGMLEQPVPGHITDMDGAPATVRDVLFCEVC